MSTLKGPGPWRAKSRQEIERRYGIIQASADGLHWPDASKWIKPCYLPEAITATLVNGITGKPVEAIHCNIDIHRPLLEVLDDLVSKNLHTELETFDGSFNIRAVRGVPGLLSLHSWGIALDFNAKENPLNSESDWAPAFTDVWKTHGFTWGGDFSRKDPMHFQFCAKF